MQRLQWKWLVPAAVVLSVTLALAAQAGGTPQGEKYTENAGQNVERMLTAYKLMDIGYKEKNPQSLLMAADMLARIEIKPTTDKLKVGKDLKETLKAGDANLPEQLIEDALKMDVPKDERPVVEAMAKWVKAKLAQTRDLNYPVYAVVELAAGKEMEWVRKPQAKTVTRVLVKGEGAVAAEVSVFQEGKKIAWDYSTSPTAFVRFYALDDNDVTIVVKNLSSKKSRFMISTN
jgi:hypothetical protein